MKISELILNLQKVQHEEGDLDVFVYSTHSCIPYRHVLTINVSNIYDDIDMYLLEKYGIFYEIGNRAVIL